MITMGTDEAVEARDLWRRQCARNLMDCYAAGLEVLAGPVTGGAGRAALEALTRLMVDGMTAVRTEEDEKVFYRTAAGLCRECAGTLGGKARMFGIYGAIFEELCGKEA